MIESTGISEPLPVAQTFVMDVDNMDHGEDDGVAKDNNKLNVAESEFSSLDHYAQLDTMVSVVDALNIMDVLSSIETLADENVHGMVGLTGLSGAEETGLENDDFKGDEVKGDDGDDDKNGEEEEEEPDERTLAQLMLDQIEFANVIVLSKVHLLLKEEGENKLEEIKALLKKLNPKARILDPREDKYGDLDVEKHLLNTGLFDFEEAEESAGWKQELEKDYHVPETEEYGISSTVFRCNAMPFHPTRFRDILFGFGNYGQALKQSAAKVADDAKKAADKEKKAGNSGKADKADKDEGCGGVDKEQEPLDVFKGVVRCKGHVWLANANAYPMEIHAAGKHLWIGPGTCMMIVGLLVVFIEELSIEKTLACYNTSNNPTNIHTEPY